MTRDEALALMRRASSWRTICEVHREIYDMCGVIQEPARTTLRDLVLEAFVMGKKMDAKLREYKADWDAGFYEPNVDHRQDSKARKSA
jgi:hypothetical protein